METLTRGGYAVGGSSLDLSTGDWRVSRPEHRRQDAPCHAACPAGENPQGYIAKVAQGDLPGAWEILASANPLPAITARVCHHPCESDCNRGAYDEEIAIHAVERFLGDLAIAQGWSYPMPAVPADAPRVAILGAGPAGLSAAYHLLRNGVKATLFEAEPEAGGLLRSAIPPYRLPRSVLNGEVERLLAVGIGFEPGRRVGRDLSLDELRADFRAVFLAPGTERSRPWSADGTAPADPRSGLDLLKEWVAIGALPSYRRVAIVGGGNTALDLARVLRFSGAAEVHVITFQALPGPGVGPRDAMSAGAREIGEALEEGITIHARRAVQRLIMRAGGLAGVEMVHAKELEVAGGRRELVRFEGTETVLKVDHVVPAIGQEIDRAGFESLLGGRSSFEVDNSGQVAGHAGVFVGGDARAPGGTVSAAIGDGRRAAKAIKHYLDGLPAPIEERRQPISLAELNVNYFEHARRAAIDLLDPKSRSALAEIEGTISLGALHAEAHRCFSCGQCMACDNCWTLCPDNSVLKLDSAADGDWGYVFDYAHCKGCGICAHECPVGYITMAAEA